MISQTVEYALRAAVMLAEEPEDLKTADQIAERTMVPRGYLSKVLQHLVRAELVRAQRGLHGGFSMERDPATISVLDVLNAVEPLPRIRKCPLGLKTHRKSLCPLHRRLDETMQMIEDVLGGTTLAEMIAEASNAKPLCDVTVKRKPVSRKRPPTDSRRANRR